MQGKVIFRQLFDKETSTYTYLLADAQLGEALLIDPVYENVDRDQKLLGELGLTLKYVLDTHAHADHVTGAGALRERTGAKTGIAATAGVKCADLNLKEGDRISLGQLSLRVLATPGHTAACLSFYDGERVFTGDSLCIRSAGRCDFQGGSSAVLFESIQEKLYRLPDDTLVYPGHDYQGFTVSSIAEEKKFNRRIRATTSVAEFSATMHALKLDPPKRIHVALPANLECGKPQIQSA
jgi:sulfur dioxygenase